MVHLLRRMAHSTHLACACEILVMTAMSVLALVVVGLLGALMWYIDVTQRERMSDTDMIAAHTTILLLMVIILVAPVGLVTLSIRAAYREFCCSAARRHVFEYETTDM